MRGVNSPYATDPNEYLWNWDQDKYMSNGKFVPEDSGLHLLPLARQLVIEQGYMPGEGDASLDGPAVRASLEDCVELEIAYTADGTKRPIAVLIVNGDGDLHICNHPSWYSVDWDGTYAVPGTGHH